jgi:hypothetical protein
MENFWKENWEETQQHLIDWWNQDGLVIGNWGALATNRPHVELPQPAAVSREEWHTDPVARAAHEHYRLANSCFPGDILPITAPDLGPGSLCVHLGSEPDFSRPDTIWFHPAVADVEDVEEIGPLRFTGADRWWKFTEAYIREIKRLSQGRYLVGFPDLCNDMDILASLRDPNSLLVDMLEEPDWVEQKLTEINAAFREVYSRIHDMVDPDRTLGTASRSFFIWGPGRVGKFQCDTSVMFSEAMFERFVTPRLTELCDWVDYPLYHLDGTGAIRHLDQLLSIPSLKAIEWTPESGKPGGADPCWYPMYRKILEAGKSVQILCLKPHEVPGLLNAIGTKGVYVMPEFRDAGEVEALLGPVRSPDRAGADSSGAAGLTARRP